MKQILKSTIVVNLLFVLTSNIYAEWDIGGSVGATYWLPKWEHEIVNFDSDTSGIYGPVAFLHYGPVGLGIQYYTGEYDVSFHDTTDEINADRTDLDIIISYRIAKIFQVAVLYKQIDLEWIDVLTIKTDINGFGLGGGFSKIYQANGFMLYGFGFYLPDLDNERTTSGIDESIQFDSDGYWLEAGIGYLIPTSHLLLKAGYRYQKIDATSNGKDNWGEENKGLRAEISYYF